MFLNTLIRKNPEFIKAAVTLHQEMKLPSNCCVLDLDAIRKKRLFYKQQSPFSGYADIRDDKADRPA